jgi:hypothetical protein
VGLICSPVYANWLEAENITGWPLIMALTLTFFFYVKILLFFDENLGIYISEYALLEYISLFTITLLPSLLQA